MYIPKLELLYTSTDKCQQSMTDWQLSYIFRVPPATLYTFLELWLLWERLQFVSPWDVMPSTAFLCFSFYFVLAVGSISITGVSIPVCKPCIHQSTKPPYSLANSTRLQGSDTLNYLDECWVVRLWLLAIINKVMRSSDDTISIGNAIFKLCL